MLFRSQTEEALESARQAMQVQPVSRDAFDGPDWIVTMARVQMVAGQTQQAIDNLELALAIPGRISPALLVLDPVWDPLREEPRFQALLGLEAPAESDRDGAGG